MRRLTQIKTFLRTLLHRHQLEHELDEELADHLAQETENNIRAGLPPEEAQRAARRLIGSITLYKEESRDAWGIAFLDNCARDLRYAFATLRRHPHSRTRHRSQHHRLHLRAKHSAALIARP